MKTFYIEFLKRLLIFSAILGTIFLGISFLIPKGYFSPALPFLFFFFIAMSLLSYYFLLQSMEKKFIRFVNTYLLTTIVKLVIYVGVMLSYVLLFRKDAIPFMLGFFILYLCYTIFEVVIIVGNTSQKKKLTRTE